MSDIENIIVKHYAGSHAYGTATPTSDVDFRGIFLADKKAIMTPFFNVNEREDKNEEDTKFFELNRFMQLYTDGNPNVIETLWVEESDIVESTEMYWHLRQYNKEFLSKRVAKKFTGYAHGQISRMTNHKGWMNEERRAINALQEQVNTHKSKDLEVWIKDNFPEFIWTHIVFGHEDNKMIDFERIMRNSDIQLVSLNAPKQYHFVKLVHNYMPQQILDRDFNIMNFQQGHELVPFGEDIFAIVRKDGSRLIAADGRLLIPKHNTLSVDDIKRQPVLVVKFLRENWKRSSEIRGSFHTWKKNRNVTRSELEVKFGMDTKHAMHVVRLLRTAEELLETGVVLVKRPDAEELLAIRNGAWSYDKMMEFFEEKSNYIRNELFKKSDLPQEPDLDKAANVLIELREIQWYGKKY